MEPSSFFSSLTTLTLEKIYNKPASTFKNVNDDSKRNELVCQLTYQAVKISVQQLLRSAKRKEMAEFALAFNIDAKEHATRIFLEKRIREVFLDNGVRTTFLSMGSELLELCCSLLGIESLKDEDATAHWLSDAVTYDGLAIILQTIPLTLLKTVATERGIKPSTTQKKELIHQILTGQVVQKKKKKAQKIVFSKKKLPIKKGLTYDDIFQHYMVTELVEWCKDNGLKTRGKKKELINRILDYLDGDRENTMATPRVKKDSDSDMKDSGESDSDKENAEEEEEEDDEEEVDPVEKRLLSPVKTH